MRPREADTPCRVLYVNHVGEVSGAEMSLLTLLSHLQTDEFEPIAAAPRQGPLHALLDKLNITTQHLAPLRLHKTRNPLALAGQAGALMVRRIQLGRIIQRTHPDIIHANSLTAAVSATTWSIGMPPVVFHARDITFPERAIQWASSGAEAIIAISESVKKAVVEVAPEAADKIEVIYNGIDREQFRPQKPRGATRQMLRLEDDELLVGNVGQLVPWKRQDMFLDTAAVIASQFPQARFIMVGADMFGEHGDYVASLRTKAEELGLAKAVIWAGYRDDVADLMAAMDVMVHTAEVEPLGRVILEALCVGTPCVAVNANGPAEIIEHLESGMLAEADAQSLADAAIAVLSKPRLAEALAEGGKARVAQDFGAEQMARSTEQLYLRVRSRKLSRRWPI